MFKRCPLCFLFGYTECPAPGIVWALLLTILGTLVLGVCLLKA